MKQKEIEALRYDPTIDWIPAFKLVQREERRPVCAAIAGQGTAWWGSVNQDRHKPYRKVLNHARRMQYTTRKFMKASNYDPPKTLSFYSPERDLCIEGIHTFWPEKWLGGYVDPNSPDFSEIVVETLARISNSGYYLYRGPITCLLVAIPVQCSTIGPSFVPFTSQILSPCCWVLQVLCK